MKTKNLMVGALLALLVLVLFYRVVYSSMTSQASKAKTNQQNYESQAQQLERQLQQLTGGGTGGAPKAVSKDELAAAVPPAANETEFIRLLDQIRDESGVAVQQISPAQPTSATAGAAASGATSSTPAGITAINVGITVQGSYAQVQDYVNRLVHAPRLLVIDSENVTPGGSSSGTSSSGGPVGPVFAGQGSAPTLSAQLTVRLFTMASGSTATGSATGTAPAASGSAAPVENS